EEDDHIADYFIRSAFPPQKHITAILQALEDSQDGLSVPALQHIVNIGRGQIDKTMKFLTVESPSPIIKEGVKWRVTPAAKRYAVNQAYVDGITEIRRAEQKQMHDYMQHNECLMAFLQDALDDPSPSDCGKC